MLRVWGPAGLRGGDAKEASPGHMGEEVSVQHRVRRSDLDFCMHVGCLVAHTRMHAYRWSHTHLG